MATAAAPGPAPASWGTHLWDRAEEVFSHTLVEVGGLATTYAKFYKEQCCVVLHRFHNRLYNHGEGPY